MASNNYKTNIQFNGTFDISNIINGLKQITNTMKNMSADTSIFSGVDKDFEKINKLMLDIQSQITRGFSDNSSIKSFTKNINSLYSNLNLIETELKNIAKNEDGSFQFKNINEASKDLKELEKSISNMQNKLKDNQKQLANTLQTQGVNKTEAQAMAQTIKTAEQLKNKLEEIVKIRQQEIQLTQDEADNQKKSATATAIGKLSSTVSASDIRDRGVASNKTEAAAFVNDTIVEQMKEVQKGTLTIDEAWENVKKEIKEVGIELNSTDKAQDKINTVWTNLDTVLTKIETKVNRIKMEMETLGTVNDNGDVNLSDTSEQIIANFDFQDTDIEQISQLQAEIETLKEQIRQLGENSNLDEITQDIDNITESTQEAEEATQKSIESIIGAKEAQDNLNATFDNLKNVVTQVLSITSAWQAFKQIVTQTFNDIQNLDKAFAEIAMVTDYSVQDMWNSYDDYAKMANDLGQTTESVIKASGLFYQQGLDTAESLKLTESTMKLATLAGLDFEEATSQMTAALRGFHMEMDQGEHITDVYSELAAKAAADVNGIAYAMSKTASIANSAGMSFENTSAFLTQMIETTQEAPKQKLIVYYLQRKFEIYEKAKMGA